VRRERELFGKIMWRRRESTTPDRRRDERRTGEGARLGAPDQRWRRRESASAARDSGRHTAPMLVPTDSRIARCGRFNSHFWRRISRVLRIDSLSVGMRRGMHPAALSHHRPVDAPTDPGRDHPPSRPVFTMPIRAFTIPIRAFTMRRSSRSPSADLCVHDRPKRAPSGALRSEGRRRTRRSFGTILGSRTGRFGVKSSSNEKGV
jgi:hypothetical protein